MFDRVTLHGDQAELVWGYQPAVVLRAWRIVRNQQGWRLSGTIARIDRYYSRQRPLMFTAPRPGGFWSWPLIDLQLSDTQLAATLGPPER